MNTGEYPNRFIDYPLLKTRLLHWLGFRYDLTGFLHWGGNFWSADPLHETTVQLGESWATIMLPPGDAFIVYPDKDDKSVFSSVRLEEMREGIEDYELLRVLEKKDPQTAHRLAEKAVPSFTGYVRDTNEFRQIQKRLYEELSR